MATILIGENVPDLAQSLHLIFTRAGHRTRLTGTGGETMASAVTDPPDLIMMNPALPDMDGLDLCRRMRAHPALSVLPIVMISVHQYPHEIAAAHAAGADDYIGKPFDNHDLLARTEALIDRVPPVGRARAADR